MPKGSLTTLFVSSTCFDLSQVRADLRDFAVSLGYEPVLSEYDTFPVNPSIDAISSCLEAVRHRADIFVLVVGGRYGTLTEAGVSVTNLEFLEALSKGIPVYVFVKAEVLTLLPAWKANPTANFTHAVDTPKLFEFVDGLKSKQNLWVFPFERAQDICSALRKQLSFLMADALAIRSRLSPADPLLEELGPDSLRSYLERGSGWEFYALAHCLRENVARHSARRTDLDLGVSFGPAIHLADRLSAVHWIGRKFGEFTVVIENLGNLINRGAVPALGPPGVPGDMTRIAHLGRRFGEGYLTIIEWALEFRRASGPEEVSRALELASQLSANCISEIEEFAASLLAKVREALSSPEAGPRHLQITLTLTMPDLEPFKAEMKRLS